MIENVYQHFRKEERPFIDALSEWITEVEDQYTPYLTDFLDPRQMYIVESLVGKRDLKLYYFGGYEEERENVFSSVPITIHQPKKSLKLIFVKYVILRSLPNYLIVKF